MIKLPHHKPKHLWKGKKRYYVTPGGCYPGITTVIGATKTEADQQSIENWRKKVGEDEADRISKAAIARGNWLHGQIEKRLKGLETETESEFQPFLTSISPILERVSNPVLIESAIWHQKLGYAGTLDCLAVLDDTLTIVDWKTSGRAKDEIFILDYQVQVSAYWEALIWMYSEYDLEINRALIAIALENEPCQEFWLDREELESYSHGFRLRLNQFKELQQQQ